MFCRKSSSCYSTMYLLTPINVVVNVEDIRLPNDVEVTEFDYDMKRNR